MRNPAWHGRPAVLVAMAMIVFSAPQDSPGQNSANDDAETTEEALLPRARRRYRPWEVVALSIFGSGKEQPFTPLLLRNLFSDGWDEPWIAPPEDSNMPRRQGCPLIGSFQYYLSANLRNNLSSAPGHTFFSLTPGFRTHLGGEYFLAGGYEIPLVGPDPFGNRLTFFFVKGF